MLVTAFLLMLTDAQPLMSHSANSDFERAAYPMLQPVRSKRPKECRFVRVEVAPRDAAGQPFAFTCIDKKKRETALSTDIFDLEAMQRHLPDFREAIAKGDGGPADRVEILMDRRGKFTMRVHRRSEYLILK